MAKATSPPQLILMLLLVSFLAKHAIAFRPNYCITQLALVNQACSVLTNSNEGLVQPQEEDYEGEGDDDSDDNDGEDEERKHRRKGHGHGHENHGHGHDRKHKHKNGHEHRDGHKDERDHPRVNRECCRWLKGLDEACVCEALLRLPPFLTKPRHSYTISVGSTCKMTFKCPGVF